MQQTTVAYNSIPKNILKSCQFKSTIYKNKNIFTRLKTNAQNIPKDE